MQADVRDNSTTGQAWAGRPALAVALRAAAFLGPVALSVATTVVLAKVFPKPGTTMGVVLWWIAITTCATGVLAVADRAARGLLPLAALFRLSLVFPDQAPSRFRAALRTGTVHQLEERVSKVKAEGLSDDPIVAAETLIELVAALSKHDRVTRGHAERVRAYARMIGDEMGLDEADADRLQWAALLHDVGKLFVPAEILNKPGRLTAEEYEAVKIHPAAGATLVEPLRGWLGGWVDAVGEHHEKWDGTGYPNGLAGANISLAARIVSVADVYDVITSARSYKAPCSPTEAREELTRCAGTHFDPRVVRAFMSVSLGRLRTVMGPLSWLAQAPVLAQVSLVPTASLAGSGLMTASAVMFGGMVDAPHIAPHRAAPVELAAPAQGGTPSGATGAVSAGDTAQTSVVTVAGGPTQRTTSSTTTTTTTGVGPTTSTSTSTTVGRSPGTTIGGAPNRAPTVAEEAYATAAGTAVSVAAPGVLTNDSDDDGDALRASVASGPGHGTLTLADDGGFSYVPATGFAGTDSFAYDVADGRGGSARSEAKVVVAPVSVGTMAWYLGTSGPSATWDLVTAPNPWAFLEPDYDKDFEPGLSIERSSTGLAETDPAKLHEWALTAGSSLHIEGPVDLELWSARYGFEPGGRVSYSASLQDCAANGTGCTTIASTAAARVDSWNDGTWGWGVQALTVGTVDHTVAVGRQLRLKLVFDKPIWVALSGDRPSRLVIG